MGAEFQGHGMLNIVVIFTVESHFEECLLLQLCFVLWCAVLKTTFVL